MAKHTRDEYRGLTDLVVDYLKLKKDREYQMIDLWAIITAKFPENNVVKKWVDLGNKHTHPRFPKFLLTHPNVTSRKLGPSANDPRMVSWTFTQDKPYLQSDPKDKY